MQWTLLQRLPKCWQHGFSRRKKTKQQATGGQHTVRNGFDYWVLQGKEVLEVKESWDAQGVRADTRLAAKTVSIYSCTDDCMLESQRWPCGCSCTCTENNRCACDQICHCTCTNAPHLHTPSSTCWVSTIGSCALQADCCTQPRNSIGTACVLLYIFAEPPLTMLNKDSFPLQTLCDIYQFYIWSHRVCLCCSSGNACAERNCCQRPTNSLQ